MAKWRFRPMARADGTTIACKLNSQLDPIRLLGADRCRRCAQPRPPRAGPRPIQAAEKKLPWPSVARFGEHDRVNRVWGMGHVLHSPHVTVGGACCARAALEKGDGRPLEGISFVVSFRQDKKGKKTCLLPNGKRSFRIRAGKLIAPFRTTQKFDYARRNFENVATGGQPAEEVSRTVIWILFPLKCGSMLVILGERLYSDRDPRELNFIRLKRRR